MHGALSCVKMYPLDIRKATGQGCAMEDYKEPYWFRSFDVRAINHEDRTLMIYTGNHIIMTRDQLDHWIEDLRQLRRQYDESERSD